MSEPTPNRDRDPGPMIPVVTPPAGDVDEPADLRAPLQAILFAIAITALAISPAVIVATWRALL